YACASDVAVAITTPSASATRSGRASPTRLSDDAAQYNIAPDTEIASARSAAHPFWANAADAALQSTNAPRKTSVMSVVVRRQTLAQRNAATSAAMWRTSSFGTK